MPINRWGKTRLFTLGGFGQDHGRYRIVTERVRAIIDEEFGGEVTIRRRTAIRNDVLLGMFSEDLIVQHLVNRVRRGVGSSWSTKNQVLFFLSLSPSLCLGSANDVAGA